MNVDELKEELAEAGLFPAEGASKPDLVKAVTEQREAGKKKKRVHKTLGEYVTVVVRPLKEIDQNTDVFVSINNYTTQFAPNREVSIPKQVARFLKEEATVSEHYFDPKEVSEVSGKAGVHKTRQSPKYVVEVVSEIL